MYLPVLLQKSKTWVDVCRGGQIIIFGGEGWGEEIALKIKMEVSDNLWIHEAKGFPWGFNNCHIATLLLRSYGGVGV